ncbi:hypothetical protein HDU98_007763 [Podochytrium sp. JEL0797]|nr:hypothetical protein HDU98_007763 [Podochytrium sp. JEL0797]
MQGVPIEAENTTTPEAPVDSTAPAKEGDEFSFEDIAAEECDEGEESDFGSDAAYEELGYEALADSDEPEDELNEEADRQGAEQPIPAPPVLEISESDLIPTDDMETIRCVMMSISLPESSMPDWAKDIPESQWLPTVNLAGSDPTSARIVTSFHGGKFAPRREPGAYARHTNWGAYLQFFPKMKRIQIAGYAFTSPSLFHKAVTHPSTSVPSLDFQRLELLGDAVLKLAATEFLFDKHPLETEGQITTRLSSLISDAACKKMAEMIGLVKLIQVGPRTDVVNSSIHADAFEAVLGSIYLDSGRDMNVAKGWVTAILEATIAKLSNPKGTLQNLIQGQFSILPRYETVQEGGSSHAPNFVSTVTCDYLEDVGIGRGRSKQIAETEAANDLLNKISASNGVSF